MATIDNKKSVMKQKQLHYTKGKTAQAFDHQYTQTIQITETVEIDGQETQQTKEIKETHWAFKTINIPDETYQERQSEEYQDALKEGFKGTEEDYKTLRDYT